MAKFCPHAHHPHAFGTPPTRCPRKKSTKAVSSAQVLSGIGVLFWVPYLYCRSDVASWAEEQACVEECQPIRTERESEVVVETNFQIQVDVHRPATQGCRDGRLSRMFCSSRAGTGRCYRKATRGETGKDEREDGVFPSAGLDISEGFRT